MAAKGVGAKIKCLNKILEVFEGSFINDKEIRIPCVEDGEYVEIKVTLTCAKVPVGKAAEVGSATGASSTETVPAFAAEPVEIEMTETEKHDVKALFDLLNGK